MSSKPSKRYKNLFETSKLNKTEVIDDIIKKVTAGGDSISWSTEGKYSVPFRTWLSLEYDLRKDLKFVGSAWVDNGYKTMSFGDTVDDYTDNFSLDNPGGEVSMIDFDSFLDGVSGMDDVVDVSMKI